ncbi:AraC family transcriptional regulator [Paenibacillus sp. GCM10023248]|uniref:AraC family transcriptional regulator n=1 Tax=Bacillales TaxID=1385 RepID=UPI00237807AD|nr:MULTISPECIES: AraC family transcriptional regulator [Bacillales]MDD9267314.1 AraC family transcriptional regulator [Paenibacillus sp. MAHUQ-63]MDR6884815.1 AraC-like DNA-binding protein [Bacillus sp. 3255]
MQEYAYEYADFWYSLPHPVQMAGGCWIVRAGQNVAKPNYSVGPKMIDQISFHWVVKGEVRVSAGKRTVELGKGDLFVIFPRRPYVYETIHEAAEKPLEMIWLAMEGGQLPQLVAQLGPTPDTFWLKGVANSEVIRSLRTILQTVSQPDKDVLRETSLLYDLFWKMNNASVREEPVRREGWLDDVKDYLDLHAGENIRIEDAARSVGIHRSHLFACFRSKFGLSPQQYLQKIRLEKGANLLRETNLSVTEIALSLGYPELYSFTRAFTKYFGIAPSSYRAQDR